MINIGGNPVTLEQIRKVKLITPESAGQQWQGIRHGTLIDTILEETDRRGWKIIEQKFGLSRHGADLVGGFVFSKVPGVKAPPGQSLSLGLMTSNARRKSLRFAVGTQVTVCHNGMVVGDYTFKRQHRYEFDIKAQIIEGLDTYIDHAKKITNVVRELEAKELSKQDVNAILMEAGRTDLMPWSRVGVVDKEYNHPRFRDFTGRNAWSLLNAFTWVAKRNPPQDQIDQINGFRRLLMGQNAALAV